MVLIAVAQYGGVPWLSALNSLLNMKVPLKAGVNLNLEK